MAEAERIIGTPDIPEAAGTGPEEARDRAAARPAPPSADARPAEDATRPVGDVMRTDGSTQAESGSTRAGAPADAEGEPGGAAAAAPRGRRRIAVLFSVAAFAYALDLVSKLVVVARLEHHAPVRLIGDWLQLEAIRNAGAAFSFGEAYTVIFTVIAAAVIVVIARLARKLYSVPWAIALGLLLGGALGNLTDRVFRAPGVFKGAVVDFISPKHFAVFNLADSAIVCGGILIVLLSFRGLDPDGTVHKD
ncbi:signal peptidase II [Streptomyces sp. B3I8]|uniref:signal peptidase II n=1 Tax=Streptomyces sp. B3I8 TaxID=3042303 RepID=UPI00277E2C1D|nr:signal peptidase II [Streptomyces sp. B3I8]MDQ0786428.1 signal peptidase II [Streptomyces sp. B3I8]